MLMSTSNHIISIVHSVFLISGKRIIQFYQVHTLSSQNISAIQYFRIISKLEENSTEDTFYFMKKSGLNSKIRLDRERNVQSGTERGFEEWRDPIK